MSAATKRYPAAEHAVAVRLRRAARRRALDRTTVQSVAWWARIHYRALRMEGMSRTFARRIARAHMHCADLVAVDVTSRGRLREAPHV